MTEKIEVLIKNNVIEEVMISKNARPARICIGCYFYRQCKRTREMPCMSINRSDRNSVYYREKIN